MKNHTREKDHMQKLADRVSEKPWKEDFPFETQRTLNLVKQHDLVGAIMRKAVERGEFDDLEGAGKPLNLGENLLAPDEMHMVHKILKDSGYAPHWMELGKEVDTLWAKFNRDVDGFKKYTQMVFSEKRSSGAVRRYEQKKNKFYIQCRAQLEEISRKILDYNLNCPVPTLHRANFSVDDEMSRLTKSFLPALSDPIARLSESDL